VSDAQADLIFIGGRVRTPARESGFGQAIAVSGGLIQAIGDDEEIRDLAARAVAHGGTRDMSTDEIRALAVQAVDHAERVTVLLRRLSDLLAPAPQPGGDLS